MKTDIKDDWDFIRKSPSHVNYPRLLASCDVVSLYTSIPYNLRLEGLSCSTEKKQNLIPEHFTQAFIFEAVSFIMSNKNFQFDIYVFRISWYCNGYEVYLCLTVCYLEETISKIIILTF